MKNILRFSLVALMFMSVLVACKENKKADAPAVEETQGVIEFISPGNLAQLDLNSLQLIDVRKQEEMAKGAIPGAQNMDYFADDFESQVQTLDKSKPIYVYCKIGGRSARAAVKLQEMGFEKIYDLDGGIMAWIDQGNNIE